MQQKTLRSVERERLVNAAHRFAKISRHDPLKLFSLLYMLDIRLFRAAGRSCTGEIYYAMADGPAPGTLRPLLVMRDMDLDSAIGVITSTDHKGPWPFDPRQFCNRGLDILHELETTYGEAASRDLALDDANAWWRVYTNSRGVGAIIPYEMTLVCPTTGNAKEKSAELKSFARRFRISDKSLTDHLDSFKPAITPD